MLKTNNQTELVTTNSIFQKRKFVYFIAVLFLIGAIIEIWAVNRLSTFGGQISKIDQEKQDLALQNQILEDEIAKRSSLSEVEKYASFFGFEENSQVKYLPNEGLAFNR